MPVNGVVAPTAPVKVVSPVLLVVTLSVCAPSTVVANTTLPLDVVLIVVSAPQVTASLYVCAPVVVMLPPLMAVVPPVLVVNEDS